MGRAVTAAVIGIVFLTGAPLGAQTLRGSAAAMQKQHQVARQHDYTFLQTSAQVRRFVDSGYLVRVPGNADYQLAAVSHPYARPAVKLFIERLSAQYRSACGEKLVVTSLTRPLREQPRNASDLSVHPAGMAIDLRVSRIPACRRWLESTLLSLEKQGLLNAIRENRPPHYHVALYPQPYTRYVAQLTNARGSAQLASALQSAQKPATPKNTVTAASIPTAAPAVTRAASPVDVAAIEHVQEYQVNRGDSLWSIARRHGTTVDTLKALNGLKSTAILAGQVIAVPAAATGAEDSSN